ncbi:MAG: hypothetical protein ACREOF_11520 [Gemmatimonadales bacterium]
MAWPGELLPQDLVVKYADLQGRPDPPRDVIWSGGELEAASTVTGSDGLARNRWRIPLNASFRSTLWVGARVDDAAVAFSARVHEGYSYDYSYTRPTIPRPGPSNED